MTTQAAKQRAYTVLMHALMEERRVCGMDEETWRHRCREILEDCNLSVPTKNKTSTQPLKA